MSEINQFENCIAAFN